MIVSTISEKMEKLDAESLSSVTIKDEPYSVTSEPPPVYKRGTSSSVKIARLIAVTVVAVALILGAAIIAAAYIQSMHRPTAALTETNVLATNSALMGNAPPATKANHSTDSADLSSEAAEEAEKDRRRLDTENDLLEEFLENEGKILRLPTAGDSGNLDIDALTKMFLKRIPSDKSKCVVERRPIGSDSSAEDLIKVMPFDSKNMGESLPIVAGESVSIICSSDDDEESDDEEAILPPSHRPMLIPFGMRPPQSRFPVDQMMMGPFPLMMNNNGGGMSLPPLRNLMRPNPFGMQPPPMNNINTNDLFEQRNSNFPLLPLVRSPFPQADRPQFRPFPGNAFPQQPSRPIIQAVPQFRVPLSTSTPPASTTTEKQIIVPDLLDNSQEKSHVPEHRMNSPPETFVPHRNPIFRMPERQSNPILPPFPEGLLSLLEDLPDIFPAEDDEDNSSEHSEENEQPHRISVPIFHVSSKPLLTIPPTNQEASSKVGSPDNNKPAVPFGARPVTLPFLQVPPRSDAARQRALPMPMNIPFMNLGSIQPPPKPDGERRQEHPSFFERLIDSLLSVGNDNNKPAPAPVKPQPAIRAGSRAMRLDEPSVILARPLEVGQEPISPPAIKDRPSDSHFIQPRSVN